MYIYNRKYNKLSFFTAFAFAMCASGSVSASLLSKGRVFIAGAIQHSTIKMPIKRLQVRLRKKNFELGRRICLEGQHHFYVRKALFLPPIITFGLIGAGGVGYQNAQENKKKEGIRRERMAREKEKIRYQAALKSKLQKFTGGCIFKPISIHWLTEWFIVPPKKVLQEIKRIREETKQTLDRVAYLEKHYQIGSGDPKADSFAIGAMIMLQWHIDMSDQIVSIIASPSYLTALTNIINFKITREIDKEFFALNSTRSTLKEKLQHYQKQFAIEQPDFWDITEGVLRSLAKNSFKEVSIAFIGKITTMEFALALREYLEAEPLTEDKLKLEDLYNRAIRPREHAKGQFPVESVVKVAFPSVKSFHVIEELTELDNILKVNKKEDEIHKCGSHLLVASEPSRLYSEALQLKQKMDTLCEILKGHVGLR